MSTNKKKKSAKEKRILIASVLVAATIVAGSTFAWFTSKDEVTNRLSAVGEYGVAIAEDFTPPDEWVPGQTVKKEAKAVNTGNVDALVRMWLTGNMNIITDNGGVGINDFKELTLEASGMGGGFTMKSGINYFRTLSESDRKVMQTGDLVYAEAGFSFTNNNTGETKNVTEAHTTYGSIISVDSDSFQPSDTGLYIFRRATNDGSLEYSGYYALKTSTGEFKYFALVTKSTTDTKDVFIKGLTNKTGTELITAIATIQVRKATKSTISNDKLTWTYVDATAAAHYEVTLTDPAEGTQQDSIKIIVELDNVGDGTAADQWQKVSSANKSDTFYYTDDLEAGDATTPLVKNVTLAESVKPGSYVAFDFDLNVNLESVQITKDSTEKELTTTAAPWAAGTGNVGATASATNTDTEINVIKWTEE